MKSKEPLVTIITPSYNQGEFIEDTILSVKNQDYSNIEHIIIDGGSQDKTIDILKKYENSYNMHWISEPDGGQSDAINKGFKMARGDIVAWLNSDDCYFDVSSVSHVTKCFEQYPDTDVIYGDAVRINATNEILYIIKNRKFNDEYLKKSCFIVQPAAFFRKKVIANNQLNTELDIAMDYDFWLRINREHKFQYVNIIFAADREHAKRKIRLRRHEMIQESQLLSKTYDKWSKFDKIKNLSSFPFRKIYRIIRIWSFKHTKIKFAFDLKYSDDISLIFN
jgi:glycosyltransferase involved in cell wall biosynthesis